MFVLVCQSSMQSTLLSHSQSAQQNQHANKTKISPLSWLCQRTLTVDGWNLAPTARKFIRLSRYSWGFIHPRWCRIRFHVSQTAERPIVEVYDRSARWDSHQLQLRLAAERPDNQQHPDRWRRSKAMRQITVLLKSTTAWASPLPLTSTLEPRQVTSQKNFMPL